ncbi:MAG: hypothetical protein Q9208_005476 [Pyrenodesmia sp. 3 TL-2023]
MTGREKNLKQENVILSRDRAETEEIDGVIPDFTIQEDKELIRWLFDDCSGSDGRLFDASRSERSLRGRLLHIQEEFEKLTEVEVQEIFRSIEELQDNAEIDWKGLSKPASKAVTYLEYASVWLRGDQQCQNRLGTLHGGTIASMVDLGGSLAVASKGLFSTGVSTDLSGMCLFPQLKELKLEDRLLMASVTYLNPGGKIGDLLRAVLSPSPLPFFLPLAYEEGRK